MITIVKKDNPSTLYSGKRLVLLLVFCLFSPLFSTAAIRISTASGGEWNSTSTWVDGVIPLSGDDVVIATLGSASVTINGLFTCSNLTIKSNGRLVIIGTGTLNISGNVNMLKPKAGSISEFIVADGTLNVGGIFNMGAKKGNRLTKLKITSGTVNLTNLTTAGVSSEIIFDGDGVLNLSGRLTGKDHKLEAGLGTINFTGSLPQSVWAKTYHNLGISGSGNKTLTGNTRVTGLANIEGELNLNVHDLILKGAGTPLIVTGTLNPDYGNVVYAGESDQVVASIPYFGLTFRRSGAKKFSPGTKAIVGQNLNIDSPTLLEEDASISIGGNMTGAGLLEMEKGLLTIEGSNLRTGAFIPGSGTVKYGGEGEQTIRPVEYYNLVIAESGEKILPEGEQIFINNDVEVSGSLVIPGATELDINGNLTGTGDVILEEGVITISGDWMNEGELKSGTGTVRYNGNNNQIIAGKEYYNLETVEGGIKTLGDDVVIKNVLTVGENTELNLDRHVLTLAGSGKPMLNNGSLTPASSTVRYTNPDETEIAAVNYHNLDAEGGPRKLPEAGVVGVSGTFRPGTGDYKVINSTVSFNGVNQTIPPFTFYNVILTGGGTKFVDTVINVKKLSLKNGTKLDVNSNFGAKIVVIQ